MFVQIAKWLTLVIILFVQIIAHYPLLAENERPPLPIVFSNASTVSVGTALTLRCEMPTNYMFGNKEYEIWFVSDINGLIAKYSVAGK